MAVHHCRCAFLSFFLLHKQKKEHKTYPNGLVNIKKNHKDTKALSITKNVLCAAWCLSDFVIQKITK